MDNLTKQIHSKNTAVAVFTLGKLNRILKELTCQEYKLTEFDKRLLTGFYQTINQQQQMNEIGRKTSLSQFQLASAMK